MHRFICPIAVAGLSLLAGCAGKVAQPTITYPAQPAPAVIAQVPTTAIPAPVIVPQATIPSASCDAAPDPAFATRVPGGSLDRALLDRAILHHTNRARCNAGLQPLAADPTLRATATGHSADMVSHGFFGHVSPVPGRSSMAERMKAAGVRYRSAGENLATAMRLELAAAQPVYPLGARCAYSLTPRGQRVPARSYDSLARHLVRRWLDSPGHRENIMNARYRRHGASGVLDPNGRICDMVNATQLFAG